MELQQFLEITTKIGLGGGASILVFIIYKGLTSATFSRIITKFIERIWKKNTKVIAKSEVINHDFFYQIDRLVDGIVPILEFSSKNKNTIFRKYLRFYLLSHKTLIKEFIDKDEFEKMDKNQLWSCVINLSNRIINHYESEMQKNNIPWVVIEKMKINNNKYVNFAYDSISNIFRNESYDSEGNYLIIHAYLNILIVNIKNFVHHTRCVSDSIDDDLLNT